MTTSDIDFNRTQRRGFPETILCAWKSEDQLLEIFKKFADKDLTALGTRATPEQITFLVQQHQAGVLPQIHTQEESGVIVMDNSTHNLSSLVDTLPATKPEGAHVALISAGSSDVSVVQEAASVLGYFGIPHVAYVDKGVASLSRIMNLTESLSDAVAIIVVAGMDGALPSVTAGLVSVPVIAVPTSVGYGSSFEGLAALLAMLNSCAEGISVVNIDNGFGAAYQAAQIYRLASSFECASSFE